VNGYLRTADAQDQQTLETLAQRAQNGDRHSLEQLVQRIQDKDYGLALRMLWNPEDAQDSTQEILIRIVRSEPSIDQDLLLHEIRIGCTLGMLLCLDRPHRLAFILGEILELNHQETANALEIDAATFRKRVSRARNDLIAFSRAKCGLTNPENPCRCRRRVEYALNNGRMNAARPLFHIADSSSRKQLSTSTRRDSQA
jgi:DNA-directed RNA polymerase specialized sigma24 family protein